MSGTLSAIRQVVGSAIEVSHELEEGLEPVLADPAQLEQVLLKLGAHARDSMPGGGRLRLATGRAQVDEAMAASRPELRPGDYVTLQMTNIGTQQDSGADLSAIAGIARQSGGHVDVRTEGDSTSVTLYIPRLAGAEAGSGGEARGHEGSETILLVEDDTQVRDVARRALERAGYSVLVAADAEAAIAFADRHPGHIHLLITDVVLPRVNGRELAARLAIHRPAIKVLYVSGTSDGAIARHRMLEPDIEFLEKPFALDGLLRKVRQILGVDSTAEDATPWAQRSLV